jgi:lysozyme family protein
MSGRVAILVLGGVAVAFGFILSGSASGQSVADSNIPDSPQPDDSSVTDDGQLIQDTAPSGSEDLGVSQVSDFSSAIQTVISVHEGGFQKRADDPGNYRPDGTLVGTKYGISARSFPSVDIVNLTPDQAAGLYQQTYGGFAAIDDQRVLTKTLDAAVNFQNGTTGPATAILQNALNDCGQSVSVDSRLGPETIDACNQQTATDSDSLLQALCSRMLKHYKTVEAKSPGMMKWFANWEARASWLP